MELAPLSQQRRDAGCQETSSGAARHLPQRGRLLDTVPPVPVKSVFEVDSVAPEGKPFGGFMMIEREYFSWRSITELVRHITFVFVMAFFVAIFGKHYSLNELIH